MAIISKNITSSFTNLVKIITLPYGTEDAGQTYPNLHWSFGFSDSSILGHREDTFILIDLRWGVAMCPWHLA